MEIEKKYVLVYSTDKKIEKDENAIRNNKKQYKRKHRRNIQEFTDERRLRNSKKNLEQ
jgi:hypothetical protein